MLLLVLLICFARSSFVSSEKLFDLVPGGLAASQYDYSEPSFHILENDVVISYLKGIPPLFWSHQFGIANSGGQNGYIGLQGDGSLFNDTQVGRAVVFSMWDSLSAQPLTKNAVCGKFGGEGVGFSCRLKYDWSDNAHYRYHVTFLGVEGNSSWFMGSLTDLSTNIETKIGKIELPKEQV